MVTKWISQESEPKSFEESLDDFDKTDRKLAALLMIATSWAHIEDSFTSLLPKSCLGYSINILSQKEQHRSIAKLLALDLKSAAIEAIDRLRELLTALKQDTWNQLKPHEQEQIVDLLSLPTRETL